MQKLENIRNFSIIAHIDHGKSTLADRMLEKTKTIEKRKMMDQVLDSMDLERERGITIKMCPVRMEHEFENKKYILNLIDTPGHIDFSYEVSRALTAVEGCVLLVDATQGVQAQTLTTLEMAQKLGKVIIPVISKIDSPLANREEVKKEIVELLACDESDIRETSGKTGEGVLELLDEVIRKVPSPVKEFNSPDEVRALIFDFQYSNHKGVVVFVRLMDGEVKRHMPLKFAISDEEFIPLEVGVFKPQETATDTLSAGEIGYIVTGIKRPGIASVGDTITSAKKPLKELPGYDSPKPVVWASVFPESQDDFDQLRQALEKLRLTDSSYSFEEESSGTMGRGFRCGFLGMLHLEIITERLRREFQLELVVTLPTITYRVHLKSGKTEMVYSPAKFPDYGLIESTDEPWVSVRIIVPNNFIGPLMPALHDHEAIVGETETFGFDRSALTVLMPLRELMRNFFDEVKSLSSGYASYSYEFAGYEPANVAKIEVLIAEELHPALSKIVSVNRAEEEAQKTVEKLYNSIPRQMFLCKIQARCMGRIMASKTLSAMKKNVTGHLYGGDITRKKKLWEKQKKGKKKLLERATVKISHDVFLKLMRND